MAQQKAGLLRRLATRSVIATLPVAMASAYASGIFVSPPRLASYDILPVAEITVSPNTVGIATSPLYGQTLEQINQQLDAMQAIGVQNIRVFVPWGLVEQVDNQYDWSHIDDIMNAAAARNMGVLAEVNATPLWAGPNPNAPGFPLGADTPNVGAFTDFMRDFTNRYASTVSAYEIWNEPNYVQFSNPINPEAYAALLQAVYPVIKNLDPTATVVAGAVGTTQTSSFTLDPVAFVQRMLAAGAGNYFDALSVHPYGEEGAYSSSCPSCQPTMLTPREQVEAIMNLVTGKKVWISEYGLPTTPGGPFTQADQAAWIKDLLDYWQTYDPDKVGPIFLYTGQDTPNAANPTNPHDYYGLWTESGALKAAAEMLKAWLAAHPQQPGGPTDPGTPGNPGTPTNPADAIAQALNAIAQALAKAIAQAIANFFAQFAAPAPATTLVTNTEVATTEAQSRTLAIAGAATTTADGAVTADEGSAAATPATADGKATEGTAADGTAAEGAATPAADSAAAPPVAAEPVAAEPVTAEPAVTEPVTPVAATPAPATSAPTTPEATAPPAGVPATTGATESTPASTVPSSAASGSGTVKDGSGGGAPVKAPSGETGPSATKPAKGGSSGATADAGGSAPSDSSKPDSSKPATSTKPGRTQPSTKDGAASGGPAAAESSPRRHDAGGRTKAGLVSAGAAATGADGGSGESAG